MYSTYITDTTNILTLNTVFTALFKLSPFSECIFLFQDSFSPLKLSSTAETDDTVIEGELGSTFELKILATGVPSPRFLWFKVSNRSNKHSHFNRNQSITQLMI